jgi:hypothetical protein
MVEPSTEPSAAPSACWARRVWQPVRILCVSLVSSLGGTVPSRRPPQAPMRITCCLQHRRRDGARGVPGARPRSVSSYGSSKPRESSLAPEPAGLNSQMSLPRPGTGLLARAARCRSPYAGVFSNRTKPIPSCLRCADSQLEMGRVHSARREPCRYMKEQGGSRDDARVARGDLAERLDLWDRGDDVRWGFCLSCAESREWSWINRAFCRLLRDDARSEADRTLT